MSIIHPRYTLTFFIFLIIKCGSQSFGGSSNVQPLDKFVFPTSSEQLLQRQENIDFSPPVNIPTVATSMQFDQVISDKISRNILQFDQVISDKISRNILQLGQEILTKLESHSKSKAKVFSPSCIASALTLILLGSNGQTYQELKHIFDLNRENLFTAQSYKFHVEFGYLMEDLISNNSVDGTYRRRPQPSWKSTYQSEFRISPTEERNLPSSNNNDHQVEVANGIFIQNGFNLRPDYETVVSSVYRSEITPLEFHANSVQAKNYINDWVNSKTHGKIKTIIADEISPDTNVIIASALYFKGLWEKSFFESSTQMIDFFPNGYDAPPIKVPMMANGAVFPHYDAKEYGCEILGLPYKGNVSTMYIMQPYDSDANKLRQFQASLTADKIEDMISKMTRKTTVMLFPKMHITNSVNMKPIFAELGADTLFRPDKCDLSLMSDGTTYRNISNKNLIRVPLRRLSNVAQLPFSRFGYENSFTQNNGTYITRTKRGVTYKAESSFKRETEPLRLKDFVLNKRITKRTYEKKTRNRRQVNSLSLNSIKNLEALRDSFGLKNPELFVEDIIHKIDLVVNEKGTEGGAATVAYIRRSGSNVVFRVDRPFMILIRHDLTKLPLFYGTIYEPVNF